MSRIVFPLLTITLLVGVGCNSDRPLEGIDLPVAETPASVAENTWALPFLADLPAGYWDAGPHRYRFLIDCPAVGQTVESNPVEFRVTPLVGTLDGPVYLRLSGLSDGIIQPPNVGSINPRQPTIAVVSFLGLSLSTIEEAAECAGVMEFDGDRQEPMLPGDPFRP